MNIYRANHANLKLILNQNLLLSYNPVLLSSGIDINEYFNVGSAISQIPFLGKRKFLREGF